MSHRHNLFIGGTTMEEYLTEANKKVIGEYAARVFVKKDLSTVNRFVRSGNIHGLFKELGAIR